MTAPTPYLLLPGTAREALTFYQSVFGGKLVLNTYADFGRDDGPEDAIAHGTLDGPVTVYAADASAAEEAYTSSGLMFALLGTSSPEMLTAWFGRLAEDGAVTDDLQERPWNAHDGQVRDRYGLLWLIGYEH
jgi:PhnB protein